MELISTQANASMVYSIIDIMSYITILTISFITAWGFTPKLVMVSDLSAQLTGEENLKSHQFWIALFHSISVVALLCDMLVIHLL